MNWLRRQQSDLAANAVVGRAQFGSDRCIVVPLVRVQPQQRPVVGALHHAGLGREGGLDLAGGGVKAPVDAGVLQEGVSVAGQQLQARQTVIRQRRRRQVALARGEAPDPFGGRDLLPAHPGGAEQGIRLAPDTQGEHARIGVIGESLAGRRQLDADVAARQRDVGIRAAVGRGHPHLVGATVHRNVNRPVRCPGQLGRPGLEGHRRDHQRVFVRVVDLGFTKLGGHDLLDRQGQLQPGRRGLDRQRVGEQRLGLGVEDQRRIPLVGGCGELEHGLGAHRRGWWRLVAALGCQKNRCSAQLFGLRPDR